MTVRIKCDQCKEYKETLTYYSVDWKYLCDECIEENNFVPRKKLSMDEREKIWKYNWRIIRIDVRWTQHIGKLSYMENDWDFWISTVSSHLWLSINTKALKYDIAYDVYVKQNRKTK